MNLTVILMIAATANLLIAYRRRKQPVWLLVHTGAAIYLMTRLAS